MWPLNVLTAQREFHACLMHTANIDSRWAIRNCGLMLMKALLNRINGGTDTSSPRASSSHRRFSKLTYEKFPHLPEMTLRLLSSQAQGLQYDQTDVLHAQRVFPALEIVERFGLPTSRAIEIRQAIIYHLEGPIWPMREKAAKTLGSIMLESDLLNETRNLLSKDWPHHNALHGRLLYLRWLLNRFQRGVIINMNGWCPTRQSFEFWKLS